MAQITKSCYKATDGHSYFRCGAPYVQVGSYGEKKEPLTEANYLSVYDHMSTDFLREKITRSESVKIDWERENSADVNLVGDGQTKYFSVRGNVSFSYQTAKEAHLKLVRFYIEEHDLKDVLNERADTARREMKEEGNDARVCSSVWVVMDGELSRRFDTSLGVEVSGSALGLLKFTVKGDAAWSGSETITLTRGTVFAYGLHKVKRWDGDKVEDLEDDWHGLN